MSWSWERTTRCDLYVGIVQYSFALRWFLCECDLFSLPLPLRLAPPPLPLILPILFLLLLLLPPLFLLLFLLSFSLYKKSRKSILYNYLLSPTCRANEQTRVDTVHSLQ